MATHTGANHKTAAVEPVTHVRSLNSIYRGYGVGKVQKVRDALCKGEFSPAAFSLPPFRSQNFILNLDEVEVCPTPLERAKAGQWDEAWKFDLRQMAARFLTLNKGGQLSNARTEILPHQIFTAFTVVSGPRRRLMLADEVGLGKTIEAGMVWQALSQRGYANRTLIITPAGLTRQWQEEFEEKFQGRFEIFGRDFTATNPRTWDLRASAIASLDRLKRKEHKRVLLENRKWDLIIFDEAHKLSAKEYGRKTDKTHNYLLAEALRDYNDALLLLRRAFDRSGDCRERSASKALLAGYQFNFMVRSRVQREDGDEYLFDLHTVAVMPDGSIDAELSALAASSYSENELPAPHVESALGLLDKMDIEEAFLRAKNHVEQNAQLWDWDEDVELMGVARVVTNPAK